MYAVDYRRGLTMSYTMQTFLDTSRRRIQEARALLSVPKRFCDGATTCALLAAECALKAVLLYGRQATRIDDVPPDIQKQVFASKAGHNLAVLWSLQDAAIQALRSDDQQKALDALHRLHRYQHRYGLKRPERKFAESAVSAAEVMVEWMKDVVI